MDQARLKELLRRYRSGQITESRLLEALKFFPYQDLGWAKLDTHRSLRLGFPEVVYGPGKSQQQLEKIIYSLSQQHRRCLVTRVGLKMAQALQKKFPHLYYFPEARLLSLTRPTPKSRRVVAVVCAGTSDLPVAEEAAVTCEILGTKVKRIWDVGVAGLHRLLDHLPALNRAACLVVVAGMEGALAGVVGGLVGQVVVAVPTSVGYGAGLKGLAPLLTMVNSCSPNVVVVNIDNGFGAGFVAHLIARTSR
ncbi:MAG TPA: nickel pincer cofactor biosynthesis protein LarB [bacterium]|nr:nickel pincer cofactor biosynthesis protein LarB [bacterium]